MENSAHITITGTQFKALSQGINLSAIRTAIPELEALCNRKIEAAKDFDEAITVQAIKAGLLKGVLSQYIAARCNDTVSKKAQSAQQLSFLFSEEI